MPFLLFRAYECRRRKVILPFHASGRVYGADTLIYQPYIPAIGEKTAFTSEEDALKIGTLVCRKLAEKQPPTVSREEIVENLPSMRLPAAGR